MKNRKIKTFAAILLAVMLILALAACGGEKEKETSAPDNNKDTNANETQNGGESNDNITEDPVGDKTDTSDKLGFVVSNVKENIPDSNFNGKNFIILVGDPNEKVWTYTNMVVEEDTGDTIDDAYYKRNRLIEDRLNINIKQVEAIPLSSEQSRFKKSVDSGDDSFDIALMSYGAAANLAISNYCMNLNDVDYLDFEKPWWDKGSLRDLSIGNRNYLMASDISIGDNDNTWLIYFDKQHVQDAGIETPYNFVNNGTWTFDKMLEMMRIVSADLNGDGKITTDDRYGLLTHGENYAGMWIAAGQTLIAKDKDDLPYIAFGNESFYNVWEKIIEIMSDETCKNNNIEFISSGLRDGQTLFGTEILKFVRNYRENEREFGILPMPKFNESQENYYTYVAISAPLLIIPKSNPELDVTGIIVEAMAAEGHRTIMPAYYEVSIEGKFVRDVESIDMLNIAFSTRMYDLGVVFNWGSMNTHLTNLGNKKSIDVVSVLEQRTPAMQAAIDSALEVFEAD